jgi:RNA-directed DNA polymerase
VSYRKAEKDAYASGHFTENTRGVPQGSSISLFLANVACLDLDIELEREGSVFARYADDTIILCSSYEMAHRCANRMLAHGTRSRTEINFDKSEGIFLITPEPRGEMRASRYFDFLGNRISQTSVTIAARSVRRIKRRISGIIHRHLLFYPKQGLFSTNRIGPNSLDWDMVTCINEIRRYLYGSVSEADLTAVLQNPAAPLRKTRSLLSYYPLVDDPTIFRELDGWLVSAVMRAQKQRRKYIQDLVPGYRLYSEQEIISGCWYSNIVPNETRLPSFYRGWRYVRKLLDLFGAAEFPVPDYES